MPAPAAAAISLAPAPGPASASASMPFASAPAPMLLLSSAWPRWSRKLHERRQGCKPDSGWQCLACERVDQPALAFEVVHAVILQAQAAQGIQCHGSMCPAAGMLPAAGQDHGACTTQHAYDLQDSHEHVPDMPQLLLHYLSILGAAGFATAGYLIMYVQVHAGTEQPPSLPWRTKLLT